MLTHINGGNVCALVNEELSGENYECACLWSFRTFFFLEKKKMRSGNIGLKNGWLLLPSLCNVPMIIIQVIHVVYNTYYKKKGNFKKIIYLAHILSRASLIHYLLYCINKDNFWPLLQPGFSHMTFVGFWLIKQKLKSKMKWHKAKIPMSNVGFMVDCKRLPFF